MYRLLSTANITWVFDQHLFRQVSTCTGRYQLPIFHCTIVHPWRYARPLFGCAVFIWCHESQWAHNKIFAHAWHRQHPIFGLKTKTCFGSRFQIRRRTRWSLAIFADRFSQTTSFSPIISMPIIKTSLENPQCLDNVVMWKSTDIIDNLFNDTKINSFLHSESLNDTQGLDPGPKCGTLKHRISIHSTLDIECLGDDISQMGHKLPLATKFDLLIATKWVFVKCLVYSGSLNSECSNSKLFEIATI